MDKKRRKDSNYQLLSVGRWEVSPEAQRILDRLDKKRKRKEAWLAKQKAKNEQRKDAGRNR